MTTLSHPAPKPWRPPSLIWASVAVHLGALAVVILEFALWPWVLVVLALNHLLITACGLLPRNGWLGENITRLPAASADRGEWALTLDDGPDPAVTPLVLDVLAQQKVRATFFCIAERARLHRDLVKQIVDAGHSVQNHSDEHPHSFSLWGTRRIAEELTRAQRTITELTGTTPRYFRAPAGLRNLFLAPVLHRMGLRLVSWTRRGYDTRESDPARILARLEPALGGGAILLLHDGHAARGADGTPVVLTVLPQLLGLARRRGLRAVTLPEALDASAKPGDRHA